MKYSNRPTLVHSILASAIVFAAIMMVSCGKQNKSTTTITAYAFSADSAYKYIEDQLDFGSRVPGSSAHRACARYLQFMLEQNGAAARIEQGTMTNFMGNQQPIINIVGSIRPQAQQRVLLCAHWDSRPWADQEEHYDNRSMAVPGADDGASGVAVLLEVARQLNANIQLLEQKNLGVDIIFFDCEDMGTPDFYTDKPQTDHPWCLGSQMWAENFAQYGAVLYPNVHYQYGILLDMVGGADATFSREYHSMEFAQNYVEKVWRTARALGYSKMFNDQLCYPITDDHYYLNSIANIPCIDIINYNANTQTGFPHYWHTSNDDIQNISRQTLQAVGEVVLTTVLN